MKRRDLLDRLKVAGSWDVLIIGGGASGLGAAVEAVSRGYRTLLLEQYDFTIATSSRSTKLVHGGVRYLAQGDIGLVLEALRERGLLLSNAPHLVKNQKFLIPSYTWWSTPFYTLGLGIYSLLAGRWSFGASRPISRKRSIQLMPTLRRKSLRGGVVYHDGQFDDARLGINLSQTVNDLGGLSLNYFRVDDLRKEDGRITGVRATDLEGGGSYEIKARAVLNATGVFSDELMHLDRPEAADMIQPSQGVHIVLDQEFLRSEYAVMIPRTSDGRVLFAVPWYNRVIVGTTDIPKSEADIEPRATREEIDFILETAGRFLEKKPTRADIKCIFAGLRPLAAPQNAGGKTREISRRHKILVSESGLVSVIGGKWTIYREMGVDCVDLLAATGGLEDRKSGTRELRIHGYLEDYPGQTPMEAYGADREALEALVQEEPALGEWLSEELQIRKVQVVWAVRHEQALRLEDVLSRRTRALILDVEESLRIAPEALRLMTKELGKDSKWEAKELEAYRKLASGYKLNDELKMNEA